MQWPVTQDRLILLGFVWLGFVQTGAICWLLLWLDHREERIRVLMEDVARLNKRCQATRAEGPPASSPPIGSPPAMLPACPDREPMPRHR